MTQITLYVRRGSATVHEVALEASSGGYVVVSDATLELKAGDRIDIAVTYDIRGER